jgi:DNA primase catalytic core
MNWDCFARECHEALFRQDDQSQRALAYLTATRGLSVETIKRHLIGFCPSSQELPDDPSNEKWNVNEKLRKRVVVPVFSEFGVVVGAAGRSPDPSESGWWNSKFNKAKFIFMFDKARRHIFERNKAYVFEGYVDSLFSEQAGLPNSTGAMGTSVAYRKIGLYARYCDRVCICFDSDVNEAGRMGQLKTVADLGMFGFGEVSKIEVPGKKEDPDEFIRREGLDKFLALEKVLTDKEIGMALKEYERLRELTRSAKAA